jgi:hypothetical protein
MPTMTLPQVKVLLLPLKTIWSLAPVIALLLKLKLALLVGLPEV